MICDMLSCESPFREDKRPFLVMQGPKYECPIVYLAAYYSFCIFWGVLHQHEASCFRHSMRSLMIFITTNCLLIQFEHVSTSDSYSCHSGLNNQFFSFLVIFCTVPYTMWFHPVNGLVWCIVGIYFASLLIKLSNRHLCRTGLGGYLLERHSCSLTCMLQ